MGHRDFCNPFIFECLPELNSDNLIYKTLSTSILGLTLLKEVNVGVDILIISA